MKTTVFIFITMLALAGCTNTEQVQKMTDLANKDSLLLVQATQKDSSITAYLGELGQIQDNLDRIKAREKIITLYTPENKATMVDQIKELDEWIVLNDKKMNNLQAKLKKMNTKNANLESLVAHLTQEIAEKDEEIASLQASLGKANDSLRYVTARFRDSIVVIKMVRSQVYEMKNDMNTIYYVTGTMKELKDKGVIDKQGGFLGIGRTAKVHPEIDNSKYTQADMPSLKGINLNGKFRRFITTHPDNSYTINSNDKSDYLSITNPAAFWGESKYMVVAVK